MEKPAHLWRIRPLRVLGLITTPAVTEFFSGWFFAEEREPNLLG